jgi:hypothetical protein
MKEGTERKKRKCPPPQAREEFRKKTRLERKEGRKGGFRKEGRKVLGRKEGRKEGFR